MTVRILTLCGAAMMLLGIMSCERGNRFMVPRLLGVEPATVALAPGKSHQFVALGTNAHPAWSVGDADNGLVSASGLYEAPFILPSDKTVTLHADPGGFTSEITLLDVPADPLDCCGSTQAHLPSRTDTVVVDEAPQALVKVAPHYPDIAREAGVDGTVQLEVLVCRNGLIYNIVVAPGKSIPMLDAAAGDAVKKWRFKPARSGGQPVAAWTRVPVRFVLH